MDGCLVQSNLPCSVKAAGHLVLGVWICYQFRGCAVVVHLLPDRMSRYEGGKREPLDDICIVGCCWEVLLKMGEVPDNSGTVETL